MQAHYVANRVVQHEREKIKLHNPVQAFGQRVKKLIQIALLRDGLAHFQQRL